jgi:hypothetical protein
MGHWQARDRATGQVVLAKGFCTREEFLTTLIEHYGEDWVNGTVEHPARFVVEPLIKESN